MDKDYQIISVQASAGAGKTYALAKRYIKLLFDGNKTKNIIAVTFANKAFVEMKYRVIDYLKRSALGLDTNQIFENIKDNEKKSGKILDDILNDYDDFNIKTIDSFKNYILKTCAINLDISPNFIIEENYSQYLLLALDSFLQNASKSTALQDIVLNYLEQYILLEKNGWFPRDELFKEIKKAFNKSSESGKDLNKNEVKFKEIIKGKADIVYKDFTDLYMEIKEAGLNINKTFIKSLENTMIKNTPYSFNFPSRFTKESLPYNKGAEISPIADDLFEKTKKDIEDYVYFYAYNYYCSYSQIYHYVLEEFERQTKKDELIFLNEINKKTIELFKNNNDILPEIYYRLSEKYKHFLIDEFQDTSPVQWAGLQKFIEEILSRGGTFFCVGDAKQAIYDFRGGDPRIFCNIKNEFQHSKYQEELLSDNYRSHKTIIEFNNFIFNPENLKSFINAFKEEYPDDNADYGDVFKAYQHSKQNINPLKTKGYVEIELIDKGKGKDADIDIDESIIYYSKKDNEYESEGEDFCDDYIQERFLSFVEDASKRFNLNDITVLCRTNPEISKAVLWLIEKGFKVETPQTLNIKNNPIIKQIISLIKFIALPMDSLSFSSFIMGDIFCQITGLKQKEIEQFLFESAINNRDSSAYIVFRKYYPKLWEEYFEEFFVKAGFIPVYELTISILDKFKIMSNFKSSKVFVLRFLELIKDFEKEYSGIQRFVSYFEDIEKQSDGLYLKSSNSNGIKVMTIHSAKGLQFPVVIIPFLNLKTQKIDNFYIDTENPEVKPVRLLKNIKNFSESLATAYNKERVKNLLSELNVLYVALTRAECEIYVLADKQSGRHNSNFYLLLGGEKIKIGSKEKYARSQEIESQNFVKDVLEDKKNGKHDSDFVLLLSRGKIKIGSKEKYPCSQEVKSQNFIKDVLNVDYKEPDIFKKDKNKAVFYNSGNKRLLGSIKHFAISRIYSLIDKDIDIEIKKALSFTKRKFIIDDDLELSAQLKDFLSDKEIQKIFKYDEALIANEKEIIDSLGHTHRIDKLICNENEVLIYDFKSSAYDVNESSNQINKYIVLLKEIYPDKIIKGFIVNIDEKHIKAVK
jgi:ATP-dependent exoDNAse (exonuclease V) beta subunit